MYYCTRRCVINGLIPFTIRPLLHRKKMKRAVEPNQRASRKQNQSKLDNIICRQDQFNIYTIYLIHSHNKGPFNQRHKEKTNLIQSRMVNYHHCPNHHQDHHYHRYRNYHRLDNQQGTAHNPRGFSNCNRRCCGLVCKF